MDHLQTIEPILFHHLSTALVSQVVAPQVGQTISDIFTLMGWDSVISVFGAFKWDHFLPVRHILFQTQSSSSSWTFMLELPFHINLERGMTLSSFWPKMSLYTFIRYPNVVNLGQCPNLLQFSGLRLTELINQISVN